MRLSCVLYVRSAVCFSAVVLELVHLLYFCVFGVPFCVHWVFLPQGGPYPQLVQLLSYGVWAPCVLHLHVLIIRILSCIGIHCYACM